MNKAIPLGKRRRSRKKTAVNYQDRVKREYGKSGTAVGTDGDNRLLRLFNQHTFEMLYMIFDKALFIYSLILFPHCGATHRKRERSHRMSGTSI